MTSVSFGASSGGESQQVKILREYDAHERWASAQSLLRMVGEEGHKSGCKEGKRMPLSQGIEFKHRSCNDTLLVIDSRMEMHAQGGKAAADTLLIESFEDIPMRMLTSNSVMSTTVSTRSRTPLSVCVNSKLVFRSKPGDPRKRGLSSMRDISGASACE